MFKFLKRADKALELIQFSLDQTRDAYYGMTRDARIFYVNNAACEDLGYTREDLVGMSIPDIDPNTSHKGWPLHWEGLRKARSKRFESTHKRKDGTVFPVEVCVNFIEFEGEEYNFASCRDITERKKTEADLKFLEHLMKHGRDAFFVTMRDAGLYLVNDAACESLGYSRKELLGLSVLDIDPDINRKKWDENWKKTRKTGLRIFESHHRRKDGTVFPVEIKVSHVSYEGERYHFSSVRDITERKQAEKELRLTTYLLDHTRDAFYGMTRDARIFYVNEAACNDLGYSREELLSMTIPDIDPDVPMDVWETNWESLKESGSMQLETHHRRKDGAIFPVEITATYLEFGGGEYILASARDITERKAIDARLRQTQKMETIGQIAGGVAHEFNNMLQGIQGNLELIEEGITDRQELMPFIVATMKPAERSKNLTRDLMTYSRLRTLSPRRMGIAGIIRESCRNFSLMLGRTIEIKTVIAKRSVDVIIDPGELEGALLNLAVNARDAMAGGGTITVKLANTKLGGKGARELGGKPGDYVTVSVSDAGKGMPPEVLERAFDPFYTTKEVGKGSGLGLSMVYGFVKQSGGYTRIASKPGEGTTVSMHLPRAKNQTGNKGQSGTIQPSVELPTGDETVLLAEDDPVVRMLGVSMLQKLGYTVIEAKNGAKALEALRALKKGKKIHLLLTDVVMPGGMSGVELAKKARKLDPDIGVLLCTGYNPDEIRGKMKGDITFPMLLKPYRKNELAFMVREVLDGSLK